VREHDARGRHVEDAAVAAELLSTLRLDHVVGEAHRRHDDLRAVTAVGQRVGHRDASRRVAAAAVIAAFPHPVAPGVLLADGVEDVADAPGVAHPSAELRLAEDAMFAGSRASRPRDDRAAERVAVVELAVPSATTTIATPFSTIISTGHP
jgi:hypothetical protein